MVGRHKKEDSRVAVAKKGNFVAVGRYLRAKRESKGLSQMAVSQKLGYTSSQFVSNFERGLCTPSWPALRQLVKLYEIPEQEILEFLLKEQEDVIRQELFGQKLNSRNK